MGCKIYTKFTNYGSSTGYPVTYTAFGEERSYSYRLGTSKTSYGPVALYYEDEYGNRNKVVNDDSIFWETEYINTATEGRYEYKNYVMKVIIESSWNETNFYITEENPKKFKLYNHKLDGLEMTEQSTWYEKFCDTNITTRYTYKSTSGSHTTDSVWMELDDGYGNWVKVDDVVISFKDTTDNYQYYLDITYNVPPLYEDSRLASKLSTVVSTDIEVKIDNEIANSTLTSTVPFTNPESGVYVFTATPDVEFIVTVVPDSGYEFRSNSNVDCVDRGVGYSSFNFGIVDNSDGSKGIKCLFDYSYDLASITGTVFEIPSVTRTVVDVSQLNNCSTNSALSWDSGSKVEIVVTPNHGFYFNEASNIIVEGLTQEFTQVLDAGVIRIEWTASADNETVILKGSPIAIPGTKVSLYKVYNLNQANIEDMVNAVWVVPGGTTKEGAWNFVCRLTQFPLTPVVEGSGDVGNRNFSFDTVADIVAEHIQSFSCGSVNVPGGESYKDYEPYTDYKIWLPFCGFVSLDCGDIVGYDLEVIYVIDFVTGQGIIKINNGERDVAIKEIVVDSELPMFVGTNSRLTASRDAIQLADKIPVLYKYYYEPVVDSDYAEYVGNKTNQTAFVKDLSGYVKAKSCKFGFETATDAEISEAVRLFLGGVYL